MADKEAIEKSYQEMFGEFIGGLIERLQKEFEKTPVEELLRIQKKRRHRIRYYRMMERMKNKKRR